MINDHLYFKTVLLFILILICKNIETFFLEQWNVTGHLISICIFYICVINVENKCIGKTGQLKIKVKQNTNIIITKYWLICWTHVVQGTHCIVYWKLISNIYYLIFITVFYWTSFLIFKNYKLVSTLSHFSHFSLDNFVMHLFQCIHLCLIFTICLICLWYFGTKLKKMKPKLQIIFNLFSLHFEWPPPHGVF